MNRLAHSHGYEGTNFEIIKQVTWESYFPPEPNEHIKLVGVVDVVAGKRFGSYGPVIEREEA